jgi:predicted amidohydrolase
MAKKLKIATVQFDVCGDVAQNFGLIKQQIQHAAEQQVDIIHFSECCLTGYPDIDIKERENNSEIDDSLEKIGKLAKEFGLWIIVGTHYFDPEFRLPTNSLFVFDPSGSINTRYDKRVLAGAPGEIDQKHFKAGAHPAIFTINGIKCGLIICHEWRYPELFREYKALGVEIIFHSFYDGNLTQADYQSEGIELGSLISGTMRDRAANNYLWISTSNTSTPEQTFPSALIRPDGRVHSMCNRNTTELIISEIDFAKEYIDPSRYGRLRIKELFPKGLNQ